MHHRLEEAFAVIRFVHVYTIPWHIPAPYITALQHTADFRNSPALSESNKFSSFGNGIHSIKLLFDGTVIKRWRIFIIVACYNVYIFITRIPFGIIAFGCPDPNKIIDTFVLKVIEHAVPQILEA